MKPQTELINNNKVQPELGEKVTMAGKIDPRRGFCGTGIVSDKQQWNIVKIIFQHFVA